MEGRGFVKARARTAGVRDRIRVTPLNAKAEAQRALLVHGCCAWLRLASMSTWRAAESPTHASAPVCVLQDPRAGHGWPGGE